VAQRYNATWPRHGLPRDTQVLATLVVGKILLDFMSFKHWTSHRATPSQGRASQPVACVTYYTKGKILYLCLHYIYYGRRYGLGPSPSPWRTHRTVHGTVVYVLYWRTGGGASPDYNEFHMTWSLTVLVRVWIEPSAQCFRTFRHVTQGLDKERVDWRGAYPV
jgi:hypothetical protein